MQESWEMTVQSRTFWEKRKVLDTSKSSWVRNVKGQVCNLIVL